MKHTIWQTMELLGYALLAVLLGIVGAFLVKAPDAAATGLSSYEIVLGAVISITIGSIGWWLLLKRRKRALLLAYTCGLGLAMMASLVKLLGQENPSLIVRAVLLVVVTYVMWMYYVSVKRMQRSWKETRRLLWYSNLVNAVSLGLIAAVASSLFPPLAAIGFFALAAVYDAIAVWKTGHMQTLAKGFLRQRVVPGFAIAKERKEQFAILGGGDVFFIVLVAGSFVKTAAWFVAATAIGMLCALVLLFAMAQRKKFYPALPFLFAGCMAGLLIAALPGQVALALVIFVTVIVSMGFMRWRVGE